MNHKNEYILSSEKSHENAKHFWYLLGAFNCALINSGYIWAQL